jgi:hypothetical protein
MNDVMTRWFGRLHRVSGVVAYGVNDGSNIFSRSWDARFTEPELNELWQQLSGTAHAALPPGEYAETITWTFGNHIVSGVARGDLGTFFVLRLKDPRLVDAGGIERVVNEFRGLRA